MASIYIRGTSNIWQASWRVNHRTRSRSTFVPVQGEIIGGVKESKKDARMRAQLIADGYESTEKIGRHAAKVTRMLNVLSGEPTRDIPSVKELLQSYPSSKAGNVDQKTVKSISTAAKNFLKHLGARADLPITTLTPGDVDRFIESQLKEIRPGTVRKYIYSISPAFSLAVKDKLIPTNPFEKPDIGRRRSHLPRIEKGAFTIEQINLMLRTISPEWKSMVVFCIATGGQRLGDIANLKWSNIDEEAGIITMRISKTKEIARKAIPELLHQHMKNLPRSSEYIHPNMAERYSRHGAGYLSQQFRKELEYAGIIESLPEHLKGTRARTVAPLTFHCLRASAATRAHWAGINPEIIKLALGHSSDRVHAKYIRTQQEENRQVLEVVTHGIEL